MANSPPRILLLEHGRPTERISMTGMHAPPREDLGVIRAQAARDDGVPLDYMVIEAGIGMPFDFSGFKASIEQVIRSQVRTAPAGSSVLGGVESQLSAMGHKVYRDPITLFQMKY